MERYSKDRKIGEGSFGAVWLVTDTRNGEKLVMKEIKLTGLPPSEKTATMNEVKLLQRLKHPGVIEFRDSFIVKGEKLCILMEHAGGGDLCKKIQEVKRRGGKFSEAEVLRILAELVDAMTYCHHECKVSDSYPMPCPFHLASFNHTHDVSHWQPHA
jgi:serine/threonine protein kinase